MYVYFLAAASNIVYVDPATLRRATSIAGVVPTNSTDTAVTVSTTTAQLARSFGIVARQIADLLTMLQDYSDLAPNLPAVLKISCHEAMNLQVGCWFIIMYAWPIHIKCFLGKIFYLFFSIFIVVIFGIPFEANLGLVKHSHGLYRSSTEIWLCFE